MVSRHNSRDANDDDDRTLLSPPMLSLPRIHEIIAEVIAIYYLTIKYMLLTCPTPP